jgi:hypothetical protein
MPPSDSLASPTLAELYFSQGLVDQAIGVYQKLLQRDPGNERARSRLAELQAHAAALAPPASAAAPGGRGAPSEARRQALERTISKLEELRTALRKR